MNYKWRQILLANVFFLSVLSAGAATVDTAIIYSNCMHKNVKCVVIKPEQYSNDTMHFPVLYLLHGWSGDYSNWIKNAPALLHVVDENGFLVVRPDGDY